MLLSRLQDLDVQEEAVMIDVAGFAKLSMAALLTAVG